MVVARAAHYCYYFYYLAALMALHLEFELLAILLEQHLVREPVFYLELVLVLLLAMVIALVAMLDFH